MTTPLASSALFWTKLTDIPAHTSIKSFYNCTSRQIGTQSGLAKPNPDTGVFFWIVVLGERSRITAGAVNRGAAISPGQGDRLCSGQATFSQWWLTTTLNHHWLV